MVEGARKGWRRVKFGDVVRQVKDVIDPVEVGIERYVAGEHMDSDDLRIRRWGSVGEGYLGPAFHMRFLPGHVLYGSRRTYLRKVSVADFEGLCANTTFVLEPKNDDLLRDFLPMVMQSEPFAQHSIKQSRGSVNPYVNFSDLAWFEFHLPPQDIQRRLSRQLAAVDAVASATLALRDALVDTRDALTESYATAFGAHLDSTGTVREDALPEGWSLRSIRELCTGEGAGLTLGPFGSDLVVADYGSLSQGTPVIFVADVQRFRLVHESKRFISAEKHHALSAHEAIPGDVLVTKMGWPPGEACVVPRGWSRSVITADVIRLRVANKLVMADYVVASLNAYWGMRQMARIGPGTTRPKMTLAEFERIRIAVPPLEVQALVVEQVLSLNAGIDAAQLRLSSASLLKKTMLSEIGG